MDKETAPRPHVTPPATALGLGLRAHREHRGVTVRGLAADLDLDPATVSMIEHATRRPKLDYVIRVLGYLGVAGTEYRRLVALAEHTEDGYLLEGGPIGYPVLRLEYERTADAITEWSPALVPELLQTPEYARAVLDAGMLTGDEVDEGVMLRLARPDADDRGPRYTVLLGEPALHRRYGGTHVLRVQLRHLLTAIDERRASVRIVPREGSWHPSLIAPFTLFEFRKRRPLVTLDHHYVGAYVTEEGPVTRYQESLEHLTAQRALSERASREIIAKAAAALGPARDPGWSPPLPGAACG
ncbi:helix-turn-helix domain-containing protein [Amycolatopsis samaneae]|uniref:Helix-turn-helix transcriptional regulator n=1 Tax=Amycolatopsis samaneae TaxID=664691 RepID=A0ABW5G9V7_9PSEU